MSLGVRGSLAGRFAASPHWSTPRRPVLVDAVYLLAGIASGSMVAAANYYLVEPITLALLYAVPVGLLGYRFHFRSAIMASILAAALTLHSPALRPGSLFFDVLILSVAMVALAGMLAARLGLDRSVAELNAAEDPDTGFATRRATLGALAMELIRAGRYSRPVTVLLVGLDDADKAPPSGVRHHIREIGRQLEASVRDVDVVGFYAGHELLIVLPETRKEDGIPVAERLRASVERLRLILPVGGKATLATVSVGVAGYPEDSSEVDGLLESAEQAIFEAGVLGGNRVRAAKRAR